MLTQFSRTELLLGKEAMDKLSIQSCRIWNRMELAVMYVRH